MSGQVFIYDEVRYPNVTQEVKEKIFRSRQDTERRERKVINCPVCGIRLLELYSSERPIVQVKCQKCKFEQPLNTAYFRRGKRYKIK